MKKLLYPLIFVTAGLVGVISGCADLDVSKVKKNNTELTKPEGCEVVKDIRIGNYSDLVRNYQILCENKNEKLELYVRFSDRDKWEKISVR